ncbi:MAG: hypothetical protein QGI46_08970 [Planctomycetota bacterium]|nr:hypothetical protein [Planctomycetota bacterium]
MSPIAVGLAGALIAAAATAGGAALLRRLGLGDAPDARTRNRKRQSSAVPFVGGGALLLAWIFQANCAGAPWAPSLPGLPAAAAGTAASWGPWAALGAAFAVGLVDDLRPGGLAPAPKLCAQGSAGAVLAAVVALAEAGGEPLRLDVSAVSAGALWIAAAVAAMNLANTFDNADGAATGLGLAGLLAGAPVAAGPLAGFLPFNLWLRRRGDPRAYLGDSGSHLLGMLLLLTPAAWPVFLLPLFDLIRVALRRLRSGRAIWSADRSHLAHGLQAAGLSPTVLCIVLVGLASPALWLPRWWGAGCVAALFLVSAGLTRGGGASGSQLGRRGEPCPRRESGR